MGLTEKGLRLYRWTDGWGAVTVGGLWRQLDCTDGCPAHVNVNPPAGAARTSLPHPAPNTLSGSQLTLKWGWGRSHRVSFDRLVEGRQQPMVLADDFQVFRGRLQQEGPAAHLAAAPDPSGWLRVLVRHGGKVKISHLW